MKRTIFFCALLALFTGANAQKTTDYKEKHPYKDWVKPVSYTHLTLPTIA